MRLLGPIAFTLLLCACSTFRDGMAPATIDPEKEAELNRLRMIADAYHSISIEVSPSHAIDGPEVIGRAVKYSVVLENSTPETHRVAYFVHWDTTGTYVLMDTGLCSDWRDKFPPRWPEPSFRSEVLQPLSSVVKPSESSGVPNCFEIDPNSGSATIYEIDGFDPSVVEYRIAELEGRPIEY